MKTVIIGGVAGGASAAARLRRLDELSEIIVLEKGEFVSFASCGLPYYIGGKITNKQSLTVQTPQSFKTRFNIDVRVNNEVIKIDSVNKSVTVKNLNDETIYTENYDKLIISTGAEPIKPSIKGIDNKRVFTLRTIPDTMNIKNFIDNMHPTKAVVVGGGYIGVEVAENLKNAGLDVTIVELAPHIIASLDFDMAAEVHKYIKDCGIKLILNNAVEEIDDKGDNLSVKLTQGEIDADMLIMSVGVRPETKIAAECGILLNKKGSIIVDKNMKTNINDIFAVGDAVEVENFISKQPDFIPLAGPANRQGRVAANNICGINSEYKGTQGSAVLKLFDMTVATTGLSEQKASDSSIEFDKTYLYSASHAGYYPGGTNMSIKVLWEKSSKKIIGAQIVGFDGVDKRMDILATAIRFGATVTDLTELELCYAPPFSSAKDPINMVGFVAEDVISNRLKQFFWYDVENLPRDGSVTLLDIRAATEISMGKIEGFKNIPLDLLRDNISEIPKGKPVYVHCYSGLRSYIACRILSGLGYDSYNLAGGFRFYNIVMSQKDSGL